MIEEKKIFSNIDTRDFLEREINQLIKDTGLDVNYNLMTYIDYLKSDIFDRNNFIIPDKTSGYYLNDNILVLLDDIKERGNIPYEALELIRLLIVSCHEVVHAIRKSSDYYESYLDVFLEIIEDFISTNDRDFYENNWDNFHMEKDADYNGMLLALEILKKYPSLYNDNRLDIANLLELYSVKYFTYNFNIIFNKFHSLRNICPRDNGITEIIYDDNNNFNDILTIYNSFFDKNIKTIILGSDVFLSSLDINSLSSVEKNLLIDVIKDNYELESKKLDYLEKYLDNHDDYYLDTQYNLLSDRLFHLEDILDKLSSKKLVKNK